MTETGSSPLPPELRQFRRNSRIAAVVALLSGALVLGAFGFGAYEVASLEARKVELRGEVADLTAEEARLRDAVQRFKDQFERAGGFAAQGDLVATQEALRSPVDGSSTPWPVAPLDIPARPPSQAATAESRRISVPRVYFQTRDASQNVAYRTCKQVLEQAGVRVPQSELMDRGPQRTQLRYFHADDKAKAEELQTLLTQCLGQAVELSRPSHSGVNPLHFEVWLAPPAG